MCFPDERQSESYHPSERTGLGPGFAGSLCPTAQPSPAHPPGLEKSHLAEGCQFCNLPSLLAVTSARGGPLLHSFTDQIFLEHRLCMCQALF